MRQIILMIAIVTTLLSGFVATAYNSHDHRAHTDHEAIVGFSKIEAYYDAANSLTLEELSLSNFQPANHIEAWGYLKGTLWYRLSIQQQDAQKALLQISLPNLDQVNLYYQDDKGQWITQESGDTISFSQRPWPSARLGFVLPLDEINGRPFFLSIQTTSTAGVSLNVGDLSTMQSKQMWYKLFTSLFFLALGASALITGYLFYIYGDKLFLFFLIAQVTYIFAAFSYSGQLSAFYRDITTDHITSIWLPIAVLAMMIFHIHLFRSFNVKRWIFYGFMTIILCYLSLLAFQFHLPTRFILNASWMLVAAFTVLMTVGAWTLGGQKYLSQQTVRYIYTTFAISVATWLLPLLGFLPASIIGFYGLAIEGLLNISLTFSMVMRFSAIKRFELLQVKEKMEKLDLEAHVQNRMSDLYKDLLLTITHEVGTYSAIFKLALSKPSISNANKKRMQRALISLEALLDKFVLSEQLDAQKISVSSSKVNLACLIRSEAKFISDHASGVKFRLIGIDNEDSHTTTDESLFRIVIANLLSNAAKYATENTVIDVEMLCEEEELSIVIENACLEIALPDPERAFDRFYRGPKVLDRAGSGLGLYLVRRILQLLGGRCTFAIRERNRVRVKIWIPLMR